MMNNTGQNNQSVDDEPCCPELVLRHRATIERVCTLADVWEQPPAVVLLQLCRYGLHNHEEAAAFIDERN